MSHTRGQPWDHGAVTESIQRARATTASYSITIRLHTGTDPAVIGALAMKVADGGGITTALDIVDSHPDRLVIDLTCSAADADHSQEIIDAVESLEGVRVHKVSDRVFLMHLGGKISVTSKVNLRNRQDLAMAYTPGVGRVSQALADHPEDAPKLTIKGNSVAVVTDGSAVLGLGNPLGIKLLVDQGMDTINVASSISIAQLAALRQVIDIPIDLYIEAPDGLGGFTRYHELPEIIRVAAPIYLKFGLRNAPGIYPSGTHLDAIAVNQGRERVRRAAIGMEHLAHTAAHFVMSDVGAPGLGIPVVRSTQAV